MGASVATPVCSVNAAMQSVMGVARTARAFACCNAYTGDQKAVDLETDPDDKTGVHASFSAYLTALHSA